MKSIISKAVTLVTLAAALVSFSPHFGGEGFEISLNGKVVLRQFGKDIDKIQTLQLDQSSPNDKLGIRYYHCGRLGKSRTVTIKDGQDNVIKVWRFNDAATVTGDMSCSVGDILRLKKGSNNIFKLYYTSNELPQGRMLASVVFENNKIAARK